MADIPERVALDIARMARESGARRVALFGSRARGDNSPRSDIDLAVWGGDVARFALDIDSDAWTLLEFDVVDMDGDVSDSLRREVARDGVTLYEAEGGL